MDPANLEIAIYAALGGLLAIGATIFGVIWKISRASKDDRKEIYDYINKAKATLESENKDLQNNYADMREELGFIKGVLSTKK